MFSFSYSVTRQYPYKWFTPVAIIGGIILTVLFSLVNFFSNAYSMVTTTTNDPDRIEAGRWSGRVPSILTSKIQPSCDDAIILIGSTVNTNQTALSYELLSVDGSPSLAYHNDALGCDVQTVYIDFETYNGRSADLIEKSSWGVAITAEVGCMSAGIQPSNGVAFFRARYDPLTRTHEPGVSSLINVSSNTSTFLWAEALLLGFWTETLTAITHQTAQQLEALELPSSQFNLSSGYLEFTYPTLEDIESADFFSAGQYAFLDDKANIYRGNWSTLSNTSLDQLMTNASWPNIWAPADRFAKALYSAILADFGAIWDVGEYTDDSGRWHVFSRTLTESMITTSDRLHYWTENLTQIWSASTVSNKDVLSFYDGLHMAQYNGTSISPLSFTNSTIAATYTCQIPRLKSGFNIFISILVADLVLLRVAWTLYNFVVCYFLKDRLKDSNSCLGCVERYRDDDIGRRELGIIDDAGEDTTLHGEVIELTDLGGDVEEQADQQSLQRLLIRKPVGG
jgi:hypothetical protein